jgi:hypothetical protein
MFPEDYIKPGSIVCEPKIAIGKARYISVFFGKPFSSLEAEFVSWIMFL